jgi:Tfp pilus assembly protein PilW
MAPRTKARPRLTSSEEGFTLVELLVASAVGMILLLVIHGFASIAERSRSETGG